MVNAQSGNERDYRQLLEELATVIHGFLRSRFNLGNIIDDCVQESLIAIHEARHTYDFKRPFRPWLFAIVRNKTIDTLRRQRTRKQTADHYIRDQEALSQTAYSGDTGLTISDERLLEFLSHRQRDALVLTKIIGFSMAETAEKLGISEGAAKVMVHRAIGKLRQRLKEDDYA